MAWMEADYSKHTQFRWKIKWRLGHLGALGLMGQADPACRQSVLLSFSLTLCLVVLSLLFLSSGMNDPQTIFTLVIVVVTVSLFIARMCFGMFKRFGPQKVKSLGSASKILGSSVCHLVVQEFRYHMPVEFRYHMPVEFRYSDIICLWSFNIAFYRKL